MPLRSMILPAFGRVKNMRIADTVKNRAAPAMPRLSHSSTMKPEVMPEHTANNAATIASGMLFTLMKLAKLRPLPFGAMMLL